MPEERDHDSRVRADSAGVPWAGRHFNENPSAGDDGRASPGLMDALRHFRLGKNGEAEVVDAFKESRVLVPLVARLAEMNVNDRGQNVDKSAELAIVTVVGPDGRNVLPVFSSVDSMRRWNPNARPVPADAARVALAAAGEGTDIVILDATSATEFAIRRPALWCIATGQRWIPSYLDKDILPAFMAAVESESMVASLTLGPGDPDARLAGPELLVHLELEPGLASIQLKVLLERVQRRWAENELIAQRVDSLGVRISARQPV